VSSLWVFNFEEPKTFFVPVFCCFPTFTKI
jgi:hypothetical protein